MEDRKVQKSPRSPRGCASLNCRLALLVEHPGATVAQLLRLLESDALLRATLASRFRDLRPSSGKALAAAAALEKAEADAAAQRLGFKDDADLTEAGQRAEQRLAAERRRIAAQKTAQAQRPTNPASSAAKPRTVDAKE